MIFRCYEHNGQGVPVVTFKPNLEFQNHSIQVQPARWAMNPSPSMIYECVVSSLPFLFCSNVQLHHRISVKLRILFCIQCISIRGGQKK